MKLRKVLNYLKAAKDDKRIMGSNNLLKLETWVDASHAVHEDMRGHTVCVLWNLYCLR